LCLDGVPYQVIVEAKSRGIFDNFNTPSRLLSPFPTMTNVALSMMLKETPPNGYESLYFDRQSRELKGGVRKYIGRRTPDKVPSSYMEKLDYQEPLPFEFLVYVAPETIWQADFRRFKEKFLACPADRDYFAFLKGTDGLLHIRGKNRLDVALQSLDRILKQVLQMCGSETEILLFSDHGMNLVPNRRIHLQTHLKKLGYKLTDRFTRLSDEVSIPAFGLCGYVALYCREETTEKLARDIAPLEGVDLVTYKNGKDLVVLSAERGQCEISFQNGERREFSYKGQADPLLLDSVIKEIGSHTASEERWFAATANHIYPDALSNLYRSHFGNIVNHTADILVSLKDGYYYGSSIFSRLARLEATHGNALKPSSTAFLMSNFREFAPFVRPQDATSLLTAVERIMERTHS
jgi:hypothetical protein